MINRTVNQDAISWFLLSFVIIVAAALRLHDLGGESYWLDEILIIRAAKNNPWTILKGGHPALFLILAAIWLFS